MVSGNNLLHILDTVHLTIGLPVLPREFCANHSGVFCRCDVGTWNSGHHHNPGCRKKPFKSLRLNSLGPKRFYLWAWLLPPVLTLLTLGTSLVLRTGQFDAALSMLSDALAKAPAGTQVPPVNQVLVQQMIFSVTLAPLINTVFALGEELGWRGFLLPHLLPLGQWRAILVSGIIWGFWHAPTTLIFGYNFPQHPILGILAMMVGCTLLGTLLAWLYLSTQSLWVTALAHGTVNAVAGLALYFLKPGFDTMLAGSILGMSGWIPMALFIGWLVWSKRLPVIFHTPEEAVSVYTSSGPQPREE